MGKSRDLVGSGRKNRLERFAVLKLFESVTVHDNLIPASLYFNLENHII